MGGSARYRLAKKIREGKISGDEMNGYYAFSNESNPDDVKIYGWYGYEGTPNSGWVELDKNGNPVRLVPNRGKYYDDKPNKNERFMDIDGNTYNEVVSKLAPEEEDYDEDDYTQVPYGDTWVTFR